MLWEVGRLRMGFIKKTKCRNFRTVFIDTFVIEMENKIVIQSTNKKALALLERLQEKKQAIKKQMQNSPIVKKLKPNTKSR